MLPRTAGVAAGVLMILLLTRCGESPGADRATTGGDGGATPESAPSAAESSAAADRAAPRSRDLRDICDTIHNSFQCARAIEARQLPGAEGVRRRGDTLRLALRGGDTVTLVDRTNGASREEHYSYQAHWRDAGFYHLQKQYYEGSEHLLIDDRTGRRTRLADWPLRAPGGQRFAVLSLDLVAGYGPNTLQVWSWSGGRPERVWETSPSRWGPTDGRWTDSTTLTLTQHGYCDSLGGSGTGMCERDATLRYRGGTWHLQPGERTREL